MSKRNTPNSFVRTSKKFFLSAFVVASFIAYSLANHWGAGQTDPPVAAGSTLPTQTFAPLQPAQDPNAAAAPTAVAQAPTPAPSATAAQPAPQVARNGLQDGTYTGPTVDINWGYVQVQATIQNGQISDVQFLQYPADRRTSRRINSFAMPVLQQEAIQAQSANVDIISGATLTSEGFQQSLQSALNQAKGI